MQPETRYARCGEALVGYQVTGTGTHDLVWAPGAVSHLELDWEEEDRVRAIGALGASFRVIRFDKRGTGVSDRSTQVSLLEERIDDIRGVMDAAGSQRASVLGVSEGGSMACLFAATYPERTHALILWGTRARWMKAPDYPWGATREEVRQRVDINEILRDWPPGWFLETVGGDDPARRTRAARYFVSSMSPSSYAAHRKMMYEIDVRDVLPSIRVPTLVIHRTGDQIIECDAGRDLAARIPGAAFVELPGDRHPPFAEDQERVITLIREFVEGATTLKPQRALTTILFLDLVGSTERAQRLGDAGWRELLAQHYAYVRDALATHGGREVDTAGDGLLATFDGPARAIACAQIIQRAAAARGLEVRAGVHTGEVERDGAAIRGIAVHLAARIASAARPSEILVSSTVQDLVAGADLRFEDRGAHTLKGIEGPRRLLAVVA